MNIFENEDSIFGFRLIFFIKMLRNWSKFHSKLFNLISEALPLVVLNLSLWLYLSRAYCVCRYQYPRYLKIHRLFHTDPLCTNHIAKRAKQSCEGKTQQASVFGVQCIIWPTRTVLQIIAVVIIIIVVVPFCYFRLDVRALHVHVRTHQNYICLLYSNIDVRDISMIKFKIKIKRSPSSLQQGELVSRIDLIFSFLQNTLEPLKSQQF